MLPNTLNLKSRGMHIYRETISDTLWVILNKLMRLEVLDSFRLVGGTSLSLLLGHRVSIDIDMFTDLAYGSIDFMEIYRILEEEFEFIEGYNWQNSSIGNSCFLGENEEDIVKVDFFYTDCFVLPICKLENLRLAQLEEIAAMKLDVVGRGGRKKDFWDIHALQVKNGSFFHRRNDGGLFGKIPL